jgi:hypothetical protein
MQVAVHTDKRLFIGDIGNYCVRSVKLTYHAEHRTPLKAVSGFGKPEK